MTPMCASSNQKDHLIPMMELNTCAAKKTRNLWLEHRSITDTDGAVYTQQQPRKKEAFLIFSSFENALPCTGHCFVALEMMWLTEV